MTKGEEEILAERDGEGSLGVRVFGVSFVCQLCGGTLESVHEFFSDIWHQSSRGTRPIHTLRKT